MSASEVHAVSKNLLANRLDGYLVSFRSFVDIHLDADGGVLDASVFSFGGRDQPRQVIA